MRVQTLERALPSIAGFIAERTGIEIHRGERACTTGKKIYLPLRASELEMTEEDLVESVGYLFHEVGHILESNFELQADTPLKKAITGVLEDIRIQHISQKTQPSARRYLSRLVEIMVKRGLEKGFGFPPVSAETTEAQLFQFFMLYSLRRHVLEHVAVDAVLPSAEAEMVRRFPVGMRTRLDALMFEVVNCESEDDVFALADDIIEMIKDEKDKEEEQQQQQQQDAGDAADDQDGGDGQDSDQADDGDQDASGSQSGDDGQDAPGNSGDSDQSPSPDGQNAGVKALDDLLGMTDSSIIEDIGSLLQNSLNNSAQQSLVKHQGPVIRVPNLYRADIKPRPYDLDAIRAASNATRTKTLQWLSSLTDGDETHARSGMQIDPSRIWSGRFGGSIFLTQDDGIDTSADIAIVVDRSTSMNRRIREAMKATVASVSAFQVPGIDTHVSVFPWMHNEDSGVAVIKGWNESLNVLSAKAESIGTAGCTPMAEAILFASSEIIRRPKALKIIVVQTDGEPDDLLATQQVIDVARKSGIYVCALGIGTDPSEVFGTRYSASITSVSELPSAMVGLIKQAYLEQDR